MPEQTGKTIGKGVELEWAIVYWALRRSGMTFPEIQKRHPKLKPYSNSISLEAQQNVEAIAKMYGESVLKTAKHSDEIAMRLPPGIPEPKTDVLFKKGGKLIPCSVKMKKVGYQLTSAEGKTSAKLLQAAMKSAKGITAKEKKRIIEVIKEISKLPTKMLDPKNMAKAIKQRPNTVKEILGKGTKIPKEKDYQYWKQYAKSNLMEGLDGVMSIRKFKSAVIKEALTGEGLFGKSSPATAKVVLVGGKAKPINTSLINSIGATTKIDVRSKARKGITSLALRITAPS